MNLNETPDRLYQACGLEKGKLILIGVSGGADSMALLHYLTRIHGKILAVYIDHGLRETSRADGEFVAEVCADWQVDFLSESVDVMALAKQQGLSIEEAARELRYACLFRMAETHQAQAVAVAHHADDQAETILMHLLRGAGLAGLRGMAQRSTHHPWHTTIPLIRPLLSYEKRDLIQYCQEHAIPSVQDETNLDTTYFRNRLRHDLFPQLASYNPRIKANLIRLGSLIQDDYDYLQSQCESALRQVKLDKRPQQVCLLTEPFIQLHRAMQRLVLRRAIAEMRPFLRDVDFSSIERCLDWITAGDSTARVDVVDHLVMFLDENSIVFLEDGAQYQRDDWPLLTTDNIGPLVLDQVIMINERWQFCAKLLDSVPPPAELPGLQDRYTQTVDADRCGDRLWIRNPHSGDRFQPLGLQGHQQKISDILINQKISRWIRPRFPLIWNEREMIWVPGYRIASSVQIDAHTQRAVRLHFTPR